MLYRRFGFLQARVLLYKQDELRALENRLDRLDKFHAKKGPAILQSRDNDDEFRKKLMHEITTQFKEYGELIFAIFGLA